jgi:transcriptional regulator with XRE-family HTH domain
MVALNQTRRISKRGKRRSANDKPKGRALSAAAKRVAGATGTQEQFIGGRIKELRKSRQMTMQDLAKLTDLSVGFVSQLERGISSPSIRTLHDIASALGAEISWFFEKNDPETQREREFVVRSNQRRVISVYPGIVDKVLSPSLARKIQLFETQLEPGAKSGPAYPHDGEEAGVVVEGAIELQVGNQTFILGAGDSFAFDSTIPHSYRNLEDRPAKVVWAISGK